MNNFKLCLLIYAWQTFILLNARESGYVSTFTFSENRKTVQVLISGVDKELPEIVGRAQCCRCGKLHILLENMSKNAYMLRGPENQIRTLVFVEDVKGSPKVLNDWYAIPLWTESIVLRPSQCFNYSIPFSDKVNKILSVTVEVDCQRLPLQEIWKEDYRMHSVRLPVSLKEGDSCSGTVCPKIAFCRWRQEKYLPVPDDKSLFWGVAEQRPKKLALWLCLRKPGKALVRIDGCTMPLWLDYLDTKGERQKVRLECESDYQPLRLRYLEKQTAERLLYPDLNESFDFIVDLPIACRKLLRAVVEVQSLKPEQMRNLSLSDAEKIMETTKVYVDVDLKSLNPNQNGCQGNDASEEPLRSGSLTDCEREKK